MPAINNNATRSEVRRYYDELRWKPLPITRDIGLRDAKEHETGTVLIKDTWFVHAGLRPDDALVGERDHDGKPLPEFIGAQPEDDPT